MNSYGTSRDLYVDSTNPESRYTKRYRYDLLALLPDSVHRADLLSKYFVSDDAEDVLERGKLFRIMMEWDPPIDPRYDFNSLGEILQACIDNHETQDVMRGALRYFRNNKDVLTENLHQCLELPVRLLYLVMEVLDKEVDPKEELFIFYEKCAGRILREDHDGLTTWCSRFDYWLSISDMADDRSFKLLLELAESGIDTYDSEEQQVIGGLGQASFHNWYISVFRVLFQRFGCDMIKSHRNKLLTLFDKALGGRHSSNVMIMRMFLAKWWDCIEFIDERWSESSYERVIFDGNNLDICAAFLSSYPENLGILERIIETGILKELLLCDRDSEVIKYNNIDWVIGITSAHYCLHDQVKIFAGFVEDACSDSSCPTPFISGMLHQALYEESKNNVEVHRVELFVRDIISRVNGNCDFTSAQNEVVDVVRRSKISVGLKFDLLNKTSNIRFIQSNLIDCLNDLSSEHPTEVCGIALKLANQDIDYYPSEFRDVVGSLSKYNENYESVKIICNTMADKGYDDYDSILINIDKRGLINV